MKCSRLESCPFYSSGSKMGSGLNAIYIKKYCMGDNASCARFMVSEALSPDSVPQSLYPGMTDVALQLIKSAGLSSPD
jgi:hypothetical protein